MVTQNHFRATTVSAEGTFGMHAQGLPATVTPGQARAPEEATENQSLQLVPARSAALAFETPNQANAIAPISTTVTPQTLVANVGQVQPAPTSVHRALLENPQQFLLDHTMQHQQIQI